MTNENASSLEGRILTLSPTETVRIEGSLKLPGGHTAYNIVSKSKGRTDWINPCEADARGYKLAIFFNGTVDHHQGIVRSDQRLSYSCTSGAIGKCITSGHAPHAEGISALNACIRMMRADYCGNGRSFTRAGILVFKLGYNNGKPTVIPANVEFEAGWNEHGAVCIHHPRAPDVADLQEITQYCPHLEKKNSDECTEEYAVRIGALLLNASARRLR